MAGRRAKIEYRIAGAYDSETCNIKSRLCAYPVLHQVGLLDCPITDICSDNVEDHTEMHLFRHTLDLYSFLDSLVETDHDYVPVICCHNLSFDMYGLSAWLDGLPNVRVLAKSCRKPITFTICDDEGKARLVLWDTLVFSQQSLERMGDDCGYPKAKGYWDYSKIRTPETPLTNDELTYATHDVYALLAWLAWWLNRNPEIDPARLGLNVVTKTGVVRERRRVRFENFKGNGNKYTIGKYWRYLNKTQLPKTDDGLYTMIACTRGGFTFCASKHASQVYDLKDDERVYGFDAVSMHPSCMVSHHYPVNFHKATSRALEDAFYIIARKDVDYLLSKWHKPFNSAFLALFEFTDMKPKAGSLYEKHGILPLASARFTNPKYELNEDNQDHQEFVEQSDYKDTAVNPVFLFGKLVSADVCRVYITELTAWEIAQAYDFSSVRAISGYIAGRFVRPPDMAVVSVMQFYKAKNLYKDARHLHYSYGHIDERTANDLERVGIPKAIVSGMFSGTISDNDIDATYQGLKADLNALFGIEATNMYRRDTVLTSEGISYAGEHGIDNAPDNPKAWYQFGQRIVGWSRIVQHCAMQLIEPYCGDIVNGDTDSLKFTAHISDMPKILKALQRLSVAIDGAKEHECKRVKRAYPRFYDALDNIGHYAYEFDVTKFCASWNKAYCMVQSDPRDGKEHLSFTIAGLPTKRGINALADSMLSQGVPIGEICDAFLGYNVTYANDVMRLNRRVFPEWSDIATLDVNGEKVVEPKALALFPMAKTVNDTGNTENRSNCIQAVKNRPSVNTDPIMITSKGITRLRDGY